MSGRTVPEAKTALAYRRVFSSAYGKAVLTDILNDLGWPNMHLKTEGDIALHNYAKRLLWKCGIWTEGNVLRITEKLLEIEPDMESPAIQTGEPE